MPVHPLERDDDAAADRAHAPDIPVPEPRAVSGTPWPRPDHDGGHLVGGPGADHGERAGRPGREGLVVGVALVNGIAGPDVDRPDHVGQVRHQRGRVDHHDSFLAERGGGRPPQTDDPSLTSLVRPESRTSLYRLVPSDPKDSFMTIPLSILDLAPIRKGQTTTDSFAASVVLAQRAETWGYRRVWYAEHHNMSSIASSATSVIIAHVGAHTDTIRLGAGGIMLPNHAPLTIAEQFGTLEALYPGRIDLGLGRAPARTRTPCSPSAATTPRQTASLRTSWSSRDISPVRPGSQG